MNRRIGLGVRRLSIIDPSGGSQPMVGEDGAVTAVYNGEIYNHQELSAQLKALGHDFSSRSDTEVIVHGYEQWGFQNMLQKLRGMFAFALWDENRSRLFLACDRMGMKPLYYMPTDRRLYFCSEIQPLLVLGGQTASMNIEALEAYIQVGFVPGSATIFQGVWKLPPAHYLSAKGTAKTIKSYWSLSYERTHYRINEQDAVEKFRTLFDETSRLHLISDVPVGALLSGGVDSATNAAFMRKNMTGRLVTVSIGFGDRRIDEANEAAECARALGAEHHSLIYSKEFMNEYPRALMAMEEPVVRGTFMALYYLFKKCRELGLTVVLTGEGADELLGGYGWNRGIRTVNPLARIPFFQSLHGNHPGPAGRMYLTLQDQGRDRRLGRISMPLHLYYRGQIGLPGFQKGRNVLSDNIRAALKPEGGDDLFESWGYQVNECGETGLFNRLLWLQSRTRMPDLVNLMVDRMSMAHSVEARPPFMDHLLWEFCASIPPNLKVRGQPPKCVEKYLLRMAGLGIVPEPSRTHPKRGLQIPYAKWVSAPRLPDWAEEELAESTLKQTDLFNYAAVNRIRSECREGNIHMSTILMAVLSMQVWARAFLRGHGTASLG